VAAVCFVLARKYLKPSARLSEEQLSVLDGRFQHTKWVVGVSMVLVVVVFAWVTHYVLVTLNRYLALSDGPTTSLHLWPQNAIWWFFPGFFAVALCWEITLRLWSAFGQPDTAKLYRLWSDNRAGFDALRILRWMALVVAVPIGVATVLALPMHTAVRRQDIRVCGYQLELTRMAHVLKRMVARDGVEPPTPAFSELASPIRKRLICLVLLVQMALN